MRTIGNEGGNLYALDAADGSRVRRSHISDSGTTSGATVANGVVYATTRPAFGLPDD